MVSLTLKKIHAQLVRSRFKTEQFRPLSVTVIPAQETVVYLFVTRPPCEIRGVLQITDGLFVGELGHTSRPGSAFAFCFRG